MHLLSSRSSLVRSLSLAFLLATSAATAQESVAITEFLNESNGNDANSEYIELYNFGTSAVTLNGWKLRDDDTDRADIPNCSIPAKGFLIVARSKEMFEAEWLGGVASSQVVQWVSTSDPVFALGGGADEIVLLNASNQEVWRLSYANDETIGRATFLTIDSFTTRNYGTKADPGIVRNGNDDTGTLGYQSNTATADALLWTGGNHSGGTHDWGSPLRGHYSGAAAIPPTSRVINTALPGTPFNPGVRGIALHDVRMDESRYWWAVPKANEVSDGGSIRGVTGGLYADQYDWKVRNNQARPTTLEFLRYQRDNNARLYITVNTRGLIEPDPANPGKNRFYTTDTATLASLAGDWVRYTNHIVQAYRQGDTITDSRDAAILDSLVWSSAYPGDTWPKLLPANETSVPKCMYWEIGNEPTISLTGGIAVTNGLALSAQDYYNRYKAITTAMLAEDPTIKVGPCIVSYSREREHLNYLLSDPTCRVDFISYHPYGSMDDETSSVQANLQAHLTGAWSDQYVYADGVRDLVTSNGRALNSVALVASETNISNWPSNEKPLIGTMAHTIGTVESIFTWARLGLDAAHYWIWPAAQWDGFEFPVYHAYAALRDHMGDTLLDVHIEADYLRLYTTRNSATGEIAVWGLNFSPTNDRQVQISLTNLPARKKAVLYTLGNPNGATTLLSKGLPHWIPEGPANDVSWYRTDPPSNEASGFTVTLKAATINMILFEPGPTCADDWSLYP